MHKHEFFEDARDDLTGPLAGVRVLEVTSTWAGPMCGVVLADLGADVVKVEIPSGDVARSIIPIPDSEISVMHATVNRNKRSLAIDMTRPEGRQVLVDLAAQVDIVVENFKSGVLARHGLGYDDLVAVKPDIVYVSVTGWGQFGPNHEAAGYDPLAQATSGSLEDFACGQFRRVTVFVELVQFGTGLGIDPTEFAASVVRVVGDGDLRARLEAGGRRTAVETYDWNVIGRTLLGAYSRLDGAGDA